MVQKHQSGECPYCQTPMQPVVMACGVCGVEIRGKFRMSLFHQLDADEQELLEEYLLADFSIKALAQRSGMGYAAIRNRLDRLIAHYERLRQGEDAKKRILDRVAAGEITAREASELIAGLDGG